LNISIRTSYLNQAERFIKINVNKKDTEDSNSTATAVVSIK